MFARSKALGLFSPWPNSAFTVMGSNEPTQLARPTITVLSVSEWFSARAAAWSDCALVMRYDARP